MKFDIYFTIEGIEDCFSLTGETITEIQEKANSELAKRGLTIEKNNVYSIQVDRSQK